MKIRIHDVSLRCRLGRRELGELVAGYGSASRWIQIWRRRWSTVRTVSWASVCRSRRLHVGRAVPRSLMDSQHRLAMARSIFSSRKTFRVIRGLIARRATIFSGLNRSISNSATDDPDARLCARVGTSF